MSLDKIKQFQQTIFQIPRYTDKVVVEKLKHLTEDGNYEITKTIYEFIFADQAAEFDGVASDATLERFLDLDTVSTRKITFHLSNSFKVHVSREWDGNARKLTGNLDTLTVDPAGNPNQNLLEFAKLLALTRRHFDAADTKPFIDFLDEGSRQLYQSREQDLQKLERMQESFFRSMTEFTLDQHTKQQEFQRQLEAEYARRQTLLDSEHRERLNQFEAKEAELKKIRSEIDERENRQARRDIYKDLKAKLEARYKSFELTEGTKSRRRFTFGFTVFLLLLFGAVFGYCFYRNVVNDVAQINWVAVGSQIGFAIAFIGVATFFIRWNNQWFQRHADEEFKLKRLDLDIDRANWLAELAMEWRNITNADVPSELIDRFARGLFVNEKATEMDIHPAESLFTAFLGKSGSIEFDIPGKFTVQRNEVVDGNREKRGAKKEAKHGNGP